MASSSHIKSADVSPSEEIIPCDEPVLLHLKNYCPGQALPPTLAELYSKSSVENEFHALCVLLHNLMLESGYDLYDDTANSFSITKHLVTFVYSHPGCEGMLFTVTCNPLGPFVAINGCMHRKDNSDGDFLSTQLKLTDFVNPFPANEKTSDGREVYKNVKKLSNNVKETLSHKALNLMRTELGLPPLHGFLSLFPELLTNILSYLDVKSLAAVSMTCMRMNNIASDNNLWKACFIRDFKGQPTLENNVSWKEKYVFHYTRKKQAEEQRDRYQGHYPPSPVAVYPSDPFATNHPGMMPMMPGSQPFGMIGGEHDLNVSFPYGPFGRRGDRRSFEFPDSMGPPGFGESNPLPGSRFDPFGPGSGQYRPGRGGGMMDYDDALGSDRYRSLRDLPPGPPGHLGGLTRGPPGPFGGLTREPPELPGMPPGPPGSGRGRGRGSGGYGARYYGGGGFL